LGRPAAADGGEGRLRIAFVYDALVPYLSGGAERRYDELARRLAERHEVHHVSWRFWGRDREVVRDGVTLHGVGPPPAFYGGDGKRTIREAAAFAARLLPVLRRLRVDVVDASATPYLPLYAAWLATRVTRTPLVATWHEFWGEHWSTYLPDRSLVAHLARAAEAGARPLADRRVVVSNFTARRLLGGADPDAAPGVDVIGNGVDVATFRQAVPDGVQSDVVYVGRLIDEKRVDRLIEAVALLAPRFGGIRCAVVGDGPERERLEKLAAARRIQDKVTFLGRVADGRVAGLLRASTILALPSDREGFGIAVIEGQAAGLVPVVVRSPLSAAPDLVRDGVDGVLCGPEVESLAAAIGGLLADDARRQKLADAASAAAERHSWDVRATEMEHVYRSVVGAARARSQPARPVAAVAEVAGPAGGRGARR
jgi:glycosyltransferase involved in cell wall biosynthesis